MSNQLSRKFIVRDTEEDNIAIKNIDRWILIFLVLCLGLVPIVLGGKISTVASPIIENKSLLLSGEKGDVFSYFKFSLLITLTALSLSLFLFKVLFFEYKINNRNITLIILSLIVAIVVSTMLAPYKSIALFGKFDRLDGGLAYICYLLLMLIAMNIEYTKKTATYILYAFYPFIIINFTLSLMNFTGHDAMQYDLVNKFLTLFMPKGASMNEGSTLLGTLNQWNYMSGMFAVMAVMYLAWAMLDKHLIRSLVNLVFALLSITTMLMAISTSGFVTVLALIPILVIVAVKASNKKRSILLIVSFLILTTPILHVLSTKDPRVWNESIGTFTSINPYMPKEQQTSKRAVTDKINLFESRVYAAEEKFTLPELPDPNVSAGSGRAYIWGKTMEITMKRPLFGYGLDTLLYHFPQDDIGFRGGMGTKDVLVDKPHNTYLGVLFGTGIVGFIGFMGIVIFTIWEVGMALFKKELLPTYGIVLAVGWIAFLIQALFNDTLPGTAAPMFILAGMMLAMLNNQYSDKEKVKE